ncbi:HAD family hydrolase [Clostridium neuense]|uniref:HAD family hydrolase n=1 Tax=Clostridium neuense TaxID=1728934 RepID=A0ABW8THV6_9CLOT
MIKAVIFDMDGVIIDSEPIHLEFAMELFKKLGVIMSNEEYSKFIGTTSQYMWDTIKKKYNLNNKVEELIEMERNGFFEFLSSPDMTIKPIEYIPELLKALHENNYKVALASSSPIRVIEFIINSFKIRDYFDEIVTGDFVKRSKPEPDIFLYAAEKLGVLPQECAVIEDSHNGVLAAKRAGMKCIAYRNLNSGNQDISKADRIINAFNELDINNL